MKNIKIEKRHRNGLRLILCSAALICTATISAQDDETTADPVATTVKSKILRSLPKENYPMMTLHGVVLDATNHQTLGGIQLRTLGSHQYTTMTDDKGEFQIKVPVFTTSLYAYGPSFSSQQVGVANKDTTQTIRIQMLSDRFRTMYTDGTVITAQKGFTADSHSLSIDNDIENKLGADVRGILRSAAPAAGSTMFIRGLNSLNANAQPLVVVDGIEQDMQLNRAMLHFGQANNMLANISPDDIAEVKVLKNGTALYGARGANGVILINTKRGHSMATRIDANIYVGLSLEPRHPNMMNAYQYRTYATEMMGTVNGGTVASKSFPFLNNDPNGYYYQIYHNDTKWTDYTYRNALTQNYSINVQGGDDVGMYNLSVGYVDAKSTAKDNNFSRMNVRFNTDINIVRNLTTRFDISISRTASDVFDDGAPSDLSIGAITSPTFLSLIKSPIVSPYQYNAVIGGFSSLLNDYDEIYSALDKTKYSLANPVAILANASGDNKNRAENTFFNVRIEPTYEINRHLSVSTMFSYNLDRNSQRYHRPYVGVPPFEVPGLGTVTSMAASLFSKEMNIVSNTHIDWNHQYGRHTIAVTGGYNYNYFMFDDNDLSSEYKNETNDKNPTLSSSTSAYPHIAGNNDVWKNLRWYANADYNYMNRYFADLSLVAEANSRFGANAGGLKAFGVSWALFPSAQLGWVMSNEKWFPKNIGINYLRLNGGFEMTGNDDISNYAARTSFTSVRYLYNYTGLQLTNIGNDEIKWETNYKWNLGFASYLLDNRLGIDFNFYTNTTKDLLTMMTFNNPISGINNYWTNGGSLRNSGYEVTVTGKPVVTKNFNVELGASIGHYVNKVTSLPNGDYTTSIYGDNNILTSVGSPVGLFYGYKSLGVFSTDVEAQSAGKGTYLYVVDKAGTPHNFVAGDVHFADLNGDGVIDTNDKTVIGNPNPDIYGNIFAMVNYKDFTLDIGFNYCLGNDVYNYQRSIINSGSTFYNQQVNEIAHWRYEGQTTDVPRIAFGDPLGNNRFSDRWIEDGSYLRLKTVKLTYRIPIPDSFTWLQGASVWAEAQNLLTFTHYTGTDPEFSIGNGALYQGIDCGNLAQGRTFTFGVKINL